VLLSSSVAMRFRDSTFTLSSVMLCLSFIHPHCHRTVLFSLIPINIAIRPSSRTGTSRFDDTATPRAPAMGAAPSSDWWNGTAISPYTARSPQRSDSPLTKILPPPRSSPSWLLRQSPRFLLLPVRPAVLPADPVKQSAPGLHYHYHYQRRGQ
jgi:hypothetical protein